MATAIIPLTQGLCAVVDAADMAMLSQYKWSCTGGRHTHAAARDPFNKGKHVKMHRLIMQAAPGQIVDHVNGDPLDNRRVNLRIVDSRQNSMNRAPRTGPTRTSSYKGVGKRGDMYIARIRVDGALIELGRSRCELESARMYNEAAVRCFGPYARLNEGV